MVHAAAPAGLMIVGLVAVAVAAPPPEIVAVLPRRRTGDQMAGAVVGVGNGARGAIIGARQTAGAVIGVSHGLRASKVRGEKHQVPIEN